MNEIEHYHPALGSLGIVELRREENFGEIDRLMMDCQIFSDLDEFKFKLVEAYREKRFHGREKEISIDIVWQDFVRKGLSERYSSVAMTWYDNGRDFEHLKRMVLDGEEPPREYNLTSSA